MVRPDQFGYNTETAKSNTFQKKRLICENHNCRKEALAEFESFVELLRKHQIEVLVFNSPAEKEAPDAVFPNNWISFHEDGKVILYPMLTKNRRIERRTEIVDELGKSFEIKKIIDLSSEELKGRILEGTGSIVFDHINKFAYANESARTNKHLFYDVCQLLGYQGIFFKAVDENGMDIYHTNVLMTIGEGYAVVCKEAIDEPDRGFVINNLQASGLEVIEISFDQMNHFAGNMIQLKSKDGKNYLVMSQAAFEILTEAQLNQLSNYVEFIHSDIHTIESVGGGSARCMIAGIHLERK
ncbi:MAG: amidinotransferase [Cyclobacteriaceae bacterium]|nr:amidinotransferase [Cyclobacteriaceae bacterium]